MSLDTNDETCFSEGSEAIIAIVYSIGEVEWIYPVWIKGPLSVVEKVCKINRDGGISRRIGEETEVGYGLITPC